MADAVTTGTDIIGALLLADAPLIALIPATRIKSGILPDGVELNALVVHETSQVERHTLVRGAKVRTTDRVSVTGRFRSVRERKRIMEMVKNICAGRTGAIAGMENVSIITAGRGPDLLGPGDSFEKTQDFRVSYDA